MKTRLPLLTAVVLLLVTVTVHATYSYYYTENLASPVWSNWTVTSPYYYDPLSSQTYSPGGYGGLTGYGWMFFNTPHSGGGEVSMTVRFAGSAGDNFQAYLASSTSSITGFFDEVSVSMNGGIQVWQSNSNNYYEVGSVWYFPHDGDVIRAVSVPNGNGDTIGVYVNDVLLISVAAAGQNAGPNSYWGVGASASNPTDGNVMSSASLGYQDTVAPYPVASSSITYSAYYNSVNLQWGATTDNPGGTGVYDYSVYRNGQLLGSTQSLSYSDTSVLPGTQYTYTIAATDYHFNSAGTNVTVTTPGFPPIRRTHPPLPPAAAPACVPRELTGAPAAKISTCSPVI